MVILVLELILNYYCVLLQVLNASKGTHTATLNGPYSGNGSGELITQKEVIGNKADVLPSSNSQKGNNPALDRINIKYVQ